MYIYIYMAAHRLTPNPNRKPDSLIVVLWHFSRFTIFFGLLAYTCRAQPVHG